MLYDKLKNKKPKPDMRTKKLLERVKASRTARDSLQDYMNDCYEFGMMDDRIMVGSTTRLREREEIEDVFDSTFAEALCDFASNQQDYFVPDYKEWVETSVAKGAARTAEDEANLTEAVATFNEDLYRLIRMTSFYEANEEVFKEGAISVGAIAIPVGRMNQPVRCLPIHMSSLLLDVDSYGDIDGRWFEMTMTKEHIKAELKKYMDEISAKCPKFKTGKTDGKHKVIQGNHRKWDEDSVVYYHDLIIDNKVIFSKPMKAGEPPMVIPFRWGRAQQCAWTYGPAKKALPNAKVLDELGYNNLIHLGYVSKFPVSYENDGQQNYEKGIEPGGAYPRARGSQAPAPIMPGSKGNDFFDKELLEAKIHMAFYNDTPEQKGKTPPTTTQWLDEKAKFQRRQAKRQVYREYVLPVLQRLAYVFAVKGELPDIKLDGKTVDVKFLSPMAQSSDAEEVSASMQLAGTIVSTLGEAGLASIQPYETAKNWQEKLKDTTLVLTPPDENADLVKQMLGEGRNIVQDGG